MEPYYKDDDFTKHAAEDFDAFDCSSAFTYDEIVACIRQKQNFFEDRWKRANSETEDMFMGMHAACGFFIAEFAALASEKQRKRLTEKGILREQPPQS
jgi:hypothetical protein